MTRDHMVLVLPPLDALSLAKRLERAAGELGFAWGEVKHGV